MDVVRRIAAAVDVPVTGDIEGGYGDTTVEVAKTVRQIVAAGAVGVFVPGVTDLGVLRRLVDAIAAPVNVLAAPGAPSVDELRAVGVRRVTVGGSLAAAAYAFTRLAAAELLAHGTYGAFAGHG